MSGNNNKKNQLQMKEIEVNEAPEDTSDVYEEADTPGNGVSYTFTSENLLSDFTPEDDAGHFSTLKRIDMEIQRLENRLENYGRSKRRSGMSTPTSAVRSPVAAQFKGVNFKRKRPPLVRRTNPKKQLSWGDHISHDITCFFKYNSDRLVRKDIEVGDMEQKKARTWVFFLIFLQITLCIIYGVVILYFIQPELLYYLLAVIFGVYFVLKLGSVFIYLVRRRFFLPCALPKLDEESAEHCEKILICIPAYNEDSDAFLRTISSVEKSNYPKDKLYMFFIVDGNKANSYQNLMTVLDGKENKEKVGANERVLKHGVYNGISWSVFLKEKNRGKRDSQWLFVEILRTMLFKPTYVMFVDSDTAFSPDSIFYLSATLQKDKTGKVAGVCGKLEISNFSALSDGSLSDSIFRFTTLFIVGFQIYEYHFNQILSKQAEAAYGSVTCLPGAFSLFRVEYLQDVEYEINTEELVTEQKKPEIPGSPNMSNMRPRSFYYKQTAKSLPLTLSDFFSRPTKGIVDRNLYELGEDRTLTVRFLERGLTTLYEPNAVAFTECPDTLRVLMLQRRRWNNSTFVNLGMMLLKPKLWLQLKTLPVMVFTTFDFISSYFLPTNAILLIYSVWSPVVSALSDSLNLNISIGQFLFWWIAIQMVVIATTNLSSSDMFFAVNSFFGGVMMGLALYYFVRAVIVTAIQTFLDDPVGNWPLLVMVAVFPLLHIVVTIPKPQYFFTAAFYYFMLPTLAVTIPFYSFFHLDDFSWGNR